MSDTAATEAARQPLAHLLDRAKLQNIQDGGQKRAKALCGAWIDGNAKTDANVCRVCFDIMFDEWGKGGEAT